MGAWTGLELMGRGREAGGNVRVEGCCVRRGSIYIMGYKVGDRGGGDVVNVGEGREEEDGCRFFVG